MSSCLLKHFAQGASSWSTVLQSANWSTTTRLTRTTANTWLASRSSYLILKLVLLMPIQMQHQGLDTQYSIFNTITNTLTITLLVLRFLLLHAYDHTCTYSYAGAYACACACTCIRNGARACANWNVTFLRQARGCGQPPRQRVQETRGRVVEAPAGVERMVGCAVPPAERCV